MSLLENGVAVEGNGFWPIDAMAAWLATEKERESWGIAAWEEHAIGSMPEGEEKEEWRNIWKIWKEEEEEWRKKIAEEQDANDEKDMDKKKEREREKANENQNDLADAMHVFKLLTFDEWVRKNEEAVKEIEKKAGEGVLKRKVDCILLEGGELDRWTMFLKEAKEKVESAPCPIKEGAPKAECEEAVKKLEELGAKAVLK